MDHNIKPIIKDPEKFPHDEFIPKGCIVIDDIADEFGYQVHIHREKYKDDLELQIYQPVIPDYLNTDDKKEQTRWPIIVYVQGSGWHKQELYQHTSMHVRMAEKGYLVAVVEYTPSEVMPFPIQVLDCKDAICYMKNHAGKFNGNPEHIALWGDSSGGHTALLAGITGSEYLKRDYGADYSCSVNCIVDWFGPTDISKMNYMPSALDHVSAESPEGYMIGHMNVIDNPEAVALTIPMNYIDKSREIPPILIMHGGNDMLVPFQQSCLLFEKLQTFEKEVQFVKINYGNHGFNGFNSNAALAIVLDFLKEHI